MKKLFVTFLIFVFVLVGSTSLMAADQIVTGNGNTGAGTLRQAIVDAVDGDEITFNLSSGNETITISSELGITESLTINGTNSDGSGTDVTVQVTTPGTSTWRVFNINASGKTINISNMTIKGGDISGSSGKGGGIYFAAGTLNLDDVTVSGSKATYGGGMYNSESSPTLTNCAFSGNSADDKGGGMYNNGYGGTSSPTLTNCTISGNSASNGGGMYNNGYSGGISSPILNNCTISGNTASTSGGGIYNNGYDGSTSSPTLNNCTISGNSASNGGGMYNNGYGGTSSPTLTNCILWGDNAVSGNEVNNVYGATPTYSYCDVEGNGASGTNIDSDPLFASEPNPASAPQVVADHDLLLTSGSPCLGTGSAPDASGVPTTDKDGRSRPLPAGASKVDMGAFEQYDSDASLPVELASFTATAGDGKVTLKWATESEIENLGFIMERRSKGAEEQGSRGARVQRRMGRDCRLLE